ncbi:MAG: DUF2384 domain-containing protein [Planctomycetaceae bacterium]|nr:MAG: DUF2384 domain-containing protein [Planctomycetaceae bacterium]
MITTNERSSAFISGPFHRNARPLREVVDPDSLGGWFQTPNNAFDGLKPIEVIERGEIDRLWEMVYRLRSGMPG